MEINADVQKIIIQAREKYYKESNFSDAILILDHAIRENDNEYLYYEKAKTLYDYSKFTESLEILNKGLEKNSKRYNLLHLKAEILQKESSKM